MFLFSYFRIFQLSLILSSSNQAIVNKFANCLIFFSKLNQSKWIFWMINNLRLHLKCIRMNHKFNFWFSKSSQKFRNEKKLMNRQNRFCYLFFRHQIFQINLIRYSNANIFRYIYVDLHAIWNLHKFMFFQFFRHSKSVCFNHVIFD